MPTAIGASVACVVVGVATVVIAAPTHQAVSVTMILIACSATSDLTVNNDQACALLSHFVDLLLQRIFLKKSLLLRIFLCLGDLLQRIFFKNNLQLRIFLCLGHCLVLCLSLLLVCYRLLLVCLGLLLVCLGLLLVCQDRLLNLRILLCEGLKVFVRCHWCFQNLNLPCKTGCEDFLDLGAL
jgi:hypothetical protein